MSTYDPCSLGAKLDKPTGPNTGKFLRDDGQWVAPPGGTGSSDWADITNKPATFTPSAHSHAIVDTTGLQTALDGKCASNDARLSDARTPLGHTHAVADTTGLQTALDGKAATGHTHLKANITDFAHTHPQSEVTNLVSDLAAKAASSHTHVKANITDLVLPATTPAVAGQYLSSYDAATGQFTKAAGGGADPWTYIVLASDFSTSSATAVDVTGMSFTPAINSKYEIECQFMVRTATATIGPRPGFTWPTSATDGVISLQCTSAAGSNVLQNGNISAAVLGPVGGLPNTTASWPASARGLLITGASTSGTFSVRLATETAGTNVTMKAGSFLKYRTYA